jgi:molybdate/tungstate transport system ATP-binding protein
MTLELDGLGKAYGDFAFGPVDLSVGHEVLSVLGPSGSGKTTLLSTIAGIVPPETGSISLGGRTLDGRPLEERRVGIVFQEGALFPHMTARENVDYAATDGARIDDLVALLEIGDVLDRRPPTLSGGERQRVALARTLAADPDVLLLDEPLSSLDAPIRRRLRGQLHALFASLDIPVVYVTHDQRTAAALGDRMAIFRDGTVEQVGPPDAVIERPATRFVARFTGTENVFEATVTDRTDDGTTVCVGDVTLRTDADGDRIAGSTATLCVHPSRIRLQASDSPVGEDDTNAVAGTVVRWLNEGNEYRVEVDVEIEAGASPLAITATVRPRTFDGLDVGAGSPVRVVIPPASIHCLP